MSNSYTVTLICDHYDEWFGRSCFQRYTGSPRAHVDDAAVAAIREARRVGWMTADGRASCPGHALAPDSERDVDLGACTYCGGPNDHGVDCRPASLGGTMPDLEDPLHRLKAEHEQRIASVMTIPAFPGFTNGDPS